MNPANPRYFTDGSGRAILLAGSHTWYSMQDAGSTSPPPSFNYDKWLDFISSLGHNFFRTFVWEQARWTAGGDFGWYISPTIYQRTGPGNALDGKPKFDLNKLNPDYFDRIRQNVIKAGNRGFYISLQLFQGFSVKDKYGNGGNPWQGHAYNASNNINGIDGDPNSYGDGRDIQTLNIPAITSLQELYVAGLLDTVKDLDNVIFEICNEADGNDAGTVDWENHFVNFIHAYEAGKTKQHPVLFTVLWPGGDNDILFTSNAEAVSPNGSGGYGSEPPAADGSKVIISDTDHIWGIGGDRVWAWKSFTRGLNPVFMDTYSDYDEWDNSDPNDPIWVSLRRNLGYILDYANRMDLVAMTPRGDLSTTGYCLANPAINQAEYLVYLPTGGSATVDLSDASGDLSVEWFNPGTGTTTADGTTTGGSSRLFTSPFGGDAVLYIHQ